MASTERPQTDYAGQEINVTTPPDKDGWQVTYEIGIQGKDLVVIGIHVRSILAEGERGLRGSMTTIRAGGLTAQRARELIRPGAALREFLRAAYEGRLTWPVSRSDAEKMLEARNKGASWQAKPTPEYLDFVAWLKTLPAMREVIRRGPLAMLTRRQRIAQTAALYMQSIQAGESAPRARVADAQGRDQYAVRDDLHAARAESPPLLVGGGPGKVGGQLTDEARRILDELLAPKHAAARRRTEMPGLPKARRRGQRND